MSLFGNILDKARLLQCLAILEKWQWTKGMKLAITDHGNNGVQVYIGDSNYVRSFGTKSDKQGEFNSATGQEIVFDKNGRIVVVDSGYHLAQGLSKQGSRVPEPVWW